MISFHPPKPPPRLVSHLEGPLPRMDAKVHAEGGGGGEVFPAVLAVVWPQLGSAGIGRGFIRRGGVDGRGVVGEQVLLQRRRGGEALAAGRPWAPQWC